MPPMTLWFVSSQQVKWLAQRFRADQAEWCYLGWEPLRIAQSERRCAHLPRVWVGDELNRTAYTLKQSFLDWLSALGQSQRHPAIWWSSRMASKSPIQTDLFLLMCYAEMVAVWLDGDGPRAHRIVVVEDPWLLWLFRQRYRHHRQVVIATHAGRWLLQEVGRWSVRVLWSKVSFLLWGLATMIIYRLGMPHESAGRTDLPPRGVLLYTWIVRGNLSVSGAFQDGYTGWLADLLTKGGYEVSRLTPLKIGLRNQFHRQRKLFARSWIVTPRYLRLLDVLWAATCAWFRIGQLRSVSQWRGRSYKPLLWREVLHEWGENEFPSYQLWYRAMQRLARQHRRTVRVVVYPFESQPWEKLLCLAMRREIPKVRLIGYQHAALSPLWLNYFLGHGEVHHAPLPDAVITSGPMGRRLLIEGGFPSERVWEGGTFRFASLLRKQPVPGFRHAVQDDRCRVVVAFPISWSHAAELLQALLQAFPTPMLHGENGRQLLLLLKCHPFLPIHKLLHKDQHLPSWFAVAEESLARLLPEADLFLYAPPTSSIWEARAAGIPVLKYRGELLDFESMDASDNDPFAICSRQTLRQCIEALLADRVRTDAISDWRDALQDMFSPVDEHVWLTLAARTDMVCKP